jgi:defect-in-organelle-trafficking protein DotC
VNAEYAAGRVLGSTEPALPTLADLQGAVPAAAEEEGDAEDKLRRPAMRDNALQYGAQGGLAWGTRQVNALLSERARDLSRVYDFGRLMIRAPGNLQARPPVISEARDTWRSDEGGKAIRVADRSYEILADAAFVPVPPTWQQYLIRTYGPPAPVFDRMLPRNDSERKAWIGWIAEGWREGVRQAVQTLERDLARLERDYVGMVRYRQLLAEGKVTAPVFARGAMGTTGSGRDMRVNDLTVRIMRDGQLVSDTAAWQPPVRTVAPPR